MAAVQVGRALAMLIAKHGPKQAAKIAKRLGFDIYTTINDVFQFDIEVFATYKSDKLNINIFPSATVSKSLTDLEKVVSNLSPSVTETQVNQETT